MDRTIQTKSIGVDLERRKHANAPCARESAESRRAWANPAKVTPLVGMRGLHRRVSASSWAATMRRPFTKSWVNLAYDFALVASDKIFAVLGGILFSFAPVSGAVLGVATQNKGERLVAANFGVDLLSGLTPSPLMWHHAFVKVSRATRLGAVTVGDKTYQSTESLAGGPNLEIAIGVFMGSADSAAVEVLFDNIEVSDQKKRAMTHRGIRRARCPMLGKGAVISGTATSPLGELLCLGAVRCFRATRRSRPSRWTACDPGARLNMSARSAGDGNG